MRRFVVLLSAFVLIGCAAGFKTVVVPKDGNGNGDLRACYPGPILTGPFVETAFLAAIASSHANRSKFVECMEARGYKAQMMTGDNGARWFIRE